MLLSSCGENSASRLGSAPTAASRFQISKKSAPYRREAELKPSRSGLVGPEPKPVLPKEPPPKSVALQDLLDGIGRFSTPGDRLTIQYAAFDYRSGRELASSWDEGRPRVVKLGMHELIDGLEEGLQEIETGDRREIVIPPQFARSGWPSRKIPPGATSVFVVDLLAVN